MLYYTILYARYTFEVFKSLIAQDSAAITFQERFLAGGVYVYIYVWLYLYTNMVYCMYMNTMYGLNL